VVRRICHASASNEINGSNVKEEITWDFFAMAD
jgi:hypothetical protein